MTETPKDATGKETVLTGFSGDGAVALAQPTTADTAARGSLR